MIGGGEQHRQRWASASINPITLITHDSRIYHKTTLGSTTKPSNSHIYQFVTYNDSPDIQTVQSD